MMEKRLKQKFLMNKVPKNKLRDSIYFEFVLTIINHLVTQ